MTGAENGAPYIAAWPTQFEGKVPDEPKRSTAR